MSSYDPVYKVLVGKKEAYAGILIAGLWYLIIFCAILMLGGALLDPRLSPFGRLFCFGMYLLLPWIAIGLRYGMQYPEEVK